MAGADKATKRKRSGVFRVGRDNESLVQRNEEQGMVGPYSHGHGQTFESDDGGKPTKRLINSCSLGHPVGGRGVEANINVKRSSISHSKSLLRGKTFVVVPIDKAFLGKEAAIKKMEITTFDQTRMIK